MPRPGVDVIIADPAPVRGAVLNVSQAFMLGTPARGPVDGPVTVHSLREYERRFGPRSGGRTAHDAVRAYFTERGGILHFLRVAGSNVQTASGTVGPLSANADSPGTWGNNVAVGLEADATLLGVVSSPTDPTEAGENGEEAGPLEGPSGPVRVIVYQNNLRVERSGPMRTAQQAASWSQNSSFVHFDEPQDPEAPLSPLEPVKLAGGADDLQYGGDSVRAALKLLPRAMGPGQVMFPGETTSEIHGVLMEHCEEQRRIALLDLQWEDEVSTASDAMLLQTSTGARFAQALAPALVYPGPALGTTVNVPYSAVQAGIIARVDREVGNPNEAAAGALGQSLGARGMPREYSDDSRTSLNELGVTLAKTVPAGLPFPASGVRTYGARTAAGADQPNWLWIGGSRTVMAIAHEAEAVAERYVMRQVDARRRLLAEFEQDLGGICGRYWTLGALYGDTADEAFQVDVDAVNTEETLMAGELHAIIRLKTSPAAEWVVIEIQRFPINQAF